MLTLNICSMYISLLSWGIAFFLLGFNGEIKKTKNKKTLFNTLQKRFSMQFFKCSLYNYLVESKQVISMILLPSLPFWTPGIFRTFSGFGSFPVNLIIDLRLLTFSRVCMQLFSQESPFSSLAYFQVGSTLLDFIQELTWWDEGLKVKKNDPAPNRFMCTVCCSWRKNLSTSTAFSSWSHEFWILINVIFYWGNRR